MNLNLVKVFALCVLTSRVLYAMLLNILGIAGFVTVIVYICHIEKRLFAYGQTTGDTEMTDVSAATLERASKYLTVPYGLPLFGEQVYNSLYVS